MRKWRKKRTQRFVKRRRWGMRRQAAYQLARYRVKVYRDWYQEVPDANMIVKALGHAEAAEQVVAMMGGGHADYVRVERQDVRLYRAFLDVECGTGFAYAAAIWK